MSNYKHYATALKVYYALGIENQFVDAEIQSLIPHSTASTWRAQKFRSYIGLDLEKSVQKNLRTLNNSIILLQQSLEKFFYFKFE